MVVYDRTLQKEIDKTLCKAYNNSINKSFVLYAI